MIRAACAVGGAVLKLFDDKERRSLRAEVVADIDAFDTWMQQTNRGEQLSRPERAILDTYLHWKIVGPKLVAKGSAG